MRTAGLVRYPVSTPVYVFSVKTWTVRDQFLTLAFHRGASERTLWENRTRAEWQDIRREFGVTDILTDSGWRLHLPVIARSDDYMLYGIP